MRPRFLHWGSPPSQARYARVSRARALTDARTKLLRAASVISTRPIIGGLGGFRTILTIATIKERVSEGRSGKYERNDSIRALCCTDCVGQQIGNTE